MDQGFATFDESTIFLRLVFNSAIDCILINGTREDGFELIDCSSSSDLVSLGFVKNRAYAMELDNEFVHVILLFIKGKVLELHG
jgi:hypothetical protein